MREGDIIVGLFYSNENNLIYDQIKYSEDFPQERVEEIRTLSFKFLTRILF